MPRKQKSSTHAGRLATKPQRSGCCGRFTIAATALLAAGAAVAVKLVPPTLQPPDGVESWLMFDGVCNLCDGFINFVADGDSARRVKFGAQQKHEELLRRVGAPVDLSTVVLIQGDRFYTKSTAALRTLALMDWPWCALSAAYVLPAALRDFGYDLVARYRYKVFGKVEACRVPTGDFRKRFIDYLPEEEGEVNPITGDTPFPFPY
eukprot:CAMPEP_0175280978 /NCGR_PEP_ID=MMETSP0093-20121207/50855_1 /TAXON_ID=311494 /ORGANISM="Alexandrium monilatum, Strain CCMP3105" /LENGTH=205 /DNA_ID=CAMNT_0016576087 /DNA_START=22 /DNA_END=636 /DNA_ORIENTATION=-